MTVPADIHPTMSAPGTIRLRLEPTRYRHTTLHGHWSPRSGDPEAELAALVTALDDAGRPPARLLLSVAGWARRPHHVVVAGRTVSLGYFAGQPPALLTAICADGTLLSLLVTAAVRGAPRRPAAA